jgi:hypothetical protein
MVWSSFRRGPLRALALFVVLTFAATSAEAGNFFGRRHKAAQPSAPVPTAYVVARPKAPDTNVYPMLGTFYPTPYTMVRGNRDAGGGYAPLDQFGGSMLSIDGPLSAFRATAAPVLTYTRGYDGVTRPQIGTSASYPNYPRMSPVIYPTRANVFPGFRRSETPPWWDSSINWLDQN